MADLSVKKFGGACSILLGVSYILVGIAFGFDPVRMVTTQRQFWTLYLDSPTMRQLMQWMLILGALLAFAVVPAISQLVRPGNEGLVDWVVRLAYLGFAMTAINSMWQLSTQSWLAQVYGRGNDIAKAAVLAFPAGNLDGDGWLRYGCVGTWGIVINVLALRSGAWSKLLAYLGIVGCSFYWLIPIGNLFPFNIAVVADLVATLAGGLIVGPIWFIGMGFHLRRPSGAIRRIVERSPSIG